VRFLGRINWVKGTPREFYAEYILWRDAVESAEYGDSKPLIDLFRSDRIPGPEARELIADLLERRPLTRKQGGQKTPAYRTTPAEARLQYSAELYERFRSEGKDHDTSLHEALREEKREQLDLKRDSFARGYYIAPDGFAMRYDRAIDPHEVPSGTVIEDHRTQPLDECDPIFWRTHGAREASVLPAGVTIKPAKRPMAEGVPPPDQLDEMITEAEEQTLRNHIEGRRGSTRRMQKRRGF
jgi:hypothetical protein